MPPIQSYTDEELLSLLGDDRHDAYQVLFDRYWLLVYRRLYKKLQSKVLAEEYTQELFASLWQRRHSLKISTSLLQYLNGAIRIVVINHLRAEVKKKLMLDDQYRQLVADDSQEDQLITNLYQAIQQLPVKTSDIIRESKLEGRSVKEIAARHNVTPKAVEYHITQALKKLKAYFKNIRGAAMVSIALAMLQYSLVG